LPKSDCDCVRWVNVGERCARSLFGGFSEWMIEAENVYSE